MVPLMMACIKDFGYSIYKQCPTLRQDIGTNIHHDIDPYVTHIDKIKSRNEISIIACKQNSMLGSSLDSVHQLLEIAVQSKTFYIIKSFTFSINSL